MTGTILGAIHKGSAHRNVAAEYQQAPITRTCNTLRHELLPYYYATKVDITIADSGSKDWHEVDDSRARFQNTGKWLQTIGKINRVHVCGLKVRISPETPRYHVIRCGWGPRGPGYGSYARRDPEKWYGTQDRNIFMREVEKGWQVEITLELELKEATSEIYRISMS